MRPALRLVAAAPAKLSCRCDGFCMRSSPRFAGRASTPPAPPRGSPWNPLPPPERARMLRGNAASRRFAAAGTTSYQETGQNRSEAHNSFFLRLFTDGAQDWVRSDAPGSQYLSIRCSERRLLGRAWPALQLPWKQTVRQPEPLTPVASTAWSPPARPACWQALRSAPVAAIEARQARAIRIDVVVASVRRLHSHN